MLITCLLQERTNQPHCPFPVPCGLKTNHHKPPVWPGGLAPNQRSAHNHSDSMRFPNGRNCIMPSLQHHPTFAAHFSHQLTCARVHYGLASTMLGQLPVGGCVPGMVRTLQSDFHLPDDKAAPFPEGFQRVPRRSNFVLTSVNLCAASNFPKVE